MGTLPEQQTAFTSPCCEAPRAQRSANPRTCLGTFRLLCLRRPAACALSLHVDAMPNDGLKVLVFLGSTRAGRIGARVGQ